jgi:hypothetical protein
LRHGGLQAQDCSDSPNEFNQGAARQLQSFARFDGSALSHVVGIDCEGNARRSDGKAGHLCFGPYISIEPGDYVAGFYIRRLGPPQPHPIDMDVFADGTAKLTEKRILHSELLGTVAGLLPMDFRVAQRISQLEVRLYVPADTLIEVRELVIFRTRFRSWSAQ